MSGDVVIWSETPTACGCCGGTNACACSLFVPTVGTGFAIYTSYANASSDLTAYTGNCYVFGRRNDPASSPDQNVTAISANVATANTLIISQTSTQLGLNPAPTIYMWSSVTVEAGATISAAWTESDNGTGVTVHSDFQIFLCAAFGEDPIEEKTGTGTSGTLTSSVVPAAGEYILLTILTTSGGTPPTSITGTFTITSSGSLIANPVIALWDDSGTTRELWACPKLLLPPLTEDTGTWYADQTAAQAAIDDQTSNCVGYSDYGNSPTSFTATDGGTTLTLNETYTVPVFSSDGLWGGINAVNGATLTFTSTVGVGTPSVSWAIYDDTGSVVQSSGGLVASPSTSSALPYKGRYTVECAVGSSLVTSTLTVVVSSSGTLSVNHIQARYDLGLTCAALLDC